MTAYELAHKRDLYNLAQIAINHGNSAWVDGDNVVVKTGYTVVDSQESGYVTDIVTNYKQLRQVLGY